MTWLGATCGELTPLGKVTLSTVLRFKLSTSEAEEEGDSPDKETSRNDISNQKIEKK